MAHAAVPMEPEVKVFDENVSDDAMLEQMGYTQGEFILVSKSMASVVETRVRLSHEPLLIGLYRI